MTEPVSRRRPLAAPPSRVPAAAECRRRQPSAAPVSPRRAAARQRHREAEVVGRPEHLAPAAARRRDRDRRARVRRLDASRRRQPLPRRAGSQRPGFPGDGQLPGNGQGFAGRGGGFGGISLSGTVSAVSADSITLDLESGTSITIPLDADDDVPHGHRRHGRRRHRRQRGAGDARAPGR